MKRKRSFFNIISIIILLFFIIFYTSRLIYYKYNNSKTITYSKILSERIIQEENNFKLIGQIKIKNNIYYFIGKSPNNYVNYKGLIWRIVKINSDRSITLILENSLNNMTYSNTLKWLNYGNLEYTGIFEEFLYGVNTNKENTNYLSKNEYLDCSDTSKIRLLSEEDYNIIDSNDSYINNNIDFWISNNKYINNDGNIYINETNDEYHNIRPVIILKSDTEISSGNGTIDKPYYIKRDKATTTKDIETGALIKYNKESWRVIEVNDDNIKILKEDCIKDEDNKCLEMIFQEYNNTINLNNTESLLYYLNNDYYNSLTNSKYLTTGTLYTGKYLNNDYKSIYEESIDVKVGIPSLADIYALEINNTFLISSNGTSNLNIYISKNNKLYETLITEKAYIRPILYLKKNITLKGKGSRVSPYTLGEIINEE